MSDFMNVIKQAGGLIPEERRGSPGRGSHRKSTGQWRLGRLILDSSRGTLVLPLRPERLSDESRALVESTGMRRVTKRTKCPCGSGRRFKECCLKFRKP